MIKSKQCCWSRYGFKHTVLNNSTFSLLHIYFMIPLAFFHPSLQIFHIEEWCSCFIFTTIHNEAICRAFKLQNFVIVFLFLLFAQFISCINNLWSLNPFGGIWIYYIWDGHHKFDFDHYKGFNTTIIGPGFWRRHCLYKKKFLYVLVTVELKFLSRLRLVG